MLVHADGHSPSGQLPLMEIHCCPSWTEHGCWIGFSYFAIRSGYTVCRMAVILTFAMLFDCFGCKGTKIYSDIKAACSFFVNGSEGE